MSNSQESSPASKPSSPALGSASTWVRAHKLVTAAVGVFALTVLGSALTSGHTRKPTPPPAAASSFNSEAPATEQPSPTEPAAPTEQASPSPAPTVLPSPSMSKAAVLALVAPAARPSPAATPARPVAVAPAKPSPTPKARTASPPPPAARTYANCTELRKDYAGGVALPGAVNKGGATQHAPYYSKALYDANSSKDRDHDGIACEA